jgi:transcription elongation factor GreA
MEDQNAVYLTQDGIKKLKEELDYLTKVRRPEVAQQINEAKADGDISENAGYDEAKNAQGFVEGRILTVKNMLSKAVLITEGKTSDTVELGDKVSIKDVDFGDEETYTIVGSAEVDPGNGLISLKSPIGQALMRRRVGDVVDVKTPGGMVQFEILTIG